METKHLIWAIALFSIVLVICGTLIYINEHAWVIRFEMDNNTRDAIVSIDWDSVYETLEYEYVRNEDTSMEVEIG